MDNLELELQQIFEPGKRENFRNQKAKNIDLFTKYGIGEITVLLDKIENLDYGKFENVNHLFGKLESCLRVCNFLEESQKNTEDDTDQIIITLLISLAEASYRLIKPDEKVYENLVKGFLKPISNKLEYKIKSNSINRCETGESEVKKIFNYAETLYYMRNDYIHNHNHLGYFFLNGTNSSNMGSTFSYTEKDSNVLLTASTECSITYQEFLGIFLEAFKKCIEKYI